MFRRRLITGFLGGMTLLVLSLHGDLSVGMDVAYAQAAGASNPVASFLTFYTLIIGHIITVLNFLAWFLFYMLDIVMDPTFIFDLQANGADGGLMNMLREIWVLCRDLVNLGLAMLLIYEAVVMIVKADGTKVKEMLPKFVIALVAVNFSWFLPRAIFDLSQVVTYTIYQIPSMIGQDGCSMPTADGAGVQPCEVVTQFAFLKETDTMTPQGGGAFLNVADGSTGWRCPIQKVICVQSIPYDQANTMPMRTRIINGLIVNYARLRNLIWITSPIPAGGAPVAADPLDALLQTTAQLIKLFIALLLHVAIVFPLFAMVTAFFIRIPILWITMAMMPLVALGFVAGDKMKDFNPTTEIWEKFLAAAFLPAKVAVPFTISFILLNAGSTAQPTGAQAANLLRPLPLFADIGNTWQMLWMLIALYILWHYSFDILKKDAMMGKFAERIQGMGESLGKVAARIPMSAPIIPSGRGNMTSVQGVLNAGNLREIEGSLRGGQNIGAVLRQQAARLQGGPGPATGAPLSAGTQQATKIIQNNTNNIQAVIKTNAQALANTAPGDQAALQKQISALLQQMRKADASLNPLTNADLLEAVIQRSTNLQTMAQQLRNALVATGNAGNTNAVI